MLRRQITITAILALLVATAPTWAANMKGHWGESQIVRLHLGLSTPDGDSNYWTDKELDFNGDADDFEDASFGIDYVRTLGGRIALMASGTFFEGRTDQSYRDFVDEFGGEIFHTTKLDTSTLTLGLLFNLTRRDATIVPYVGAGGGLYGWELTEVGDFIDFGTPDLEVFFGDFFTDGEAFGYYWQAGVEVPLASNWSVFADARWHRAEDDLEGDFSGLGELDLSNRTITFGTAWSF